MIAVGIDSIAFDIPKLYLPITTLAQKRQIEPEKLTLGLGLQSMSVLDTYQDVVTMAANATLKLVQQAAIVPQEINRIYVGTESGVDSAKPVASYVVSLLETQTGADSWKNCDAVDLTFACIGAIDALQNCLDYIRLNPTKKAIVVASDYAKYDLESSGEYTQGAGAIALLITANPRILAFSQTVGVATKGVFDFFKPRRTFTKNELLQREDNPAWNGVLENEIALFKDQPVFDGHYSNQCYIQRITEAYQNFKQESKREDKIYESWAAVLMHLPYCYQGRRTFVEIVAQENPQLLASQAGETDKEKIKALAKAAVYQELVVQKIAPSELASGQVGNLYTGSIFLGMLSTLSYHWQQKTPLAAQKLGFIAYGSGSKAKVLEAQVVEGWEPQIENLQLFETLASRTMLDFEQYERLHKKEQKQPILSPQNEFYLDSIEAQNLVLIGARYYKYRG